MDSIKRKAAFVDRDGVVNYRPVNDYVKSAKEFSLIPKIGEILILLKSLDYLLILVTNQQGIGKGLMSSDDLDKVHQEMQILLNEKFELQFDGIYFSPDLKNSNSVMRKPSPGMLIKASEEHYIDLSSSIMIGDSDTDILAGQNAGCKTTILLGNSQSSNPTLTFQRHIDLYNFIINQGLQ